ncbi:MAG: C40 family peptidase [Ruminococcus sp.]|nr:C40 family peptidase [Ruminococcus sp.]
MCILSKIKRIAAACLAVLITIGAFGLTENEKSVTINAAQAPSSYEKQLKDLEEEQEKLQNKIDEADDNINNQQEKLNNVVKQLEVISKKIETSEKYSKEIEDDICKIDEQMRKTQYDLSNQEENIKKGVNEFMNRVRSMYLAGTGSYSEILINSSDFYDVLMRMELIKRVAAHDNDTIDDLINQKEKIDSTKSDLEKQKESLLNKSKKYSEEQKKLSDEYEKLISMQDQYGESIADLENNKNELQSEINSLAQEYEAKQTTTASKTTKAKSSTTKKTSANANKPKETTTTKKAVTTKKTTTTAPKTTTTKTTTNAPEPNNPTPTPSTNDYDTKINILMSTAKSMVGGSYVWGGTSPNATDCSGLTMQCYAKIGINLPHLASAQANYGTSVSYSNMKKGDLIFFGGSSYSSIYHVAIYIGDGMMIHAENSNTGIVISYVSTFAQYNNITCIKRLI